MAVEHEGSPIEQPAGERDIRSELDAALDSLAGAMKRSEAQPGSSLARAEVELARRTVAELSALLPPPTEAELLDTKRHEQQRYLAATKDDAPNVEGELAELRVKAEQKLIGRDQQTIKRNWRMAERAELNRYQELFSLADETTALRREVLALAEQKLSASQRIALEDQIAALLERYWQPRQAVGAIIAHHRKFSEKLLPDLHQLDLSGEVEAALFSLTTIKSQLLAMRDAVQPGERKTE